MYVLILWQLCLTGILSILSQLIFTIFMIDIVTIAMSQVNEARRN